MRNQQIIQTPVGDVQNHRLPNNAVGGSIKSTTTRNANRKRYTSGIFLSQIYTSQSEHRPKSIEFAVRLINRNKASFRTNKVSSFRGVVETLSHPIKHRQGDIFFSSLTKHGKPTMKNHTANTNNGNLTLSPIAFTFTQGGLANA